MRTRCREAIEVLTTIRTYLSENMNPIHDVEDGDFDWPLRIFELLERVQEGDAIAEADLKKELELWNR